LILINKYLRSLASDAVPLEDRKFLMIKQIL